MQKGLGTKIILKSEPAKTHVAPVISPFISESLIMKYKYFLKNLDKKKYLFLDTSMKKQKININDKRINISILSFTK